MAIRYTLHWEETGEIIQSGTCPSEDCLPEKPEKARFTLGVMADPDTQRMDGDTPVPKDKQSS